jgi:hypothetical protein
MERQRFQERKILLRGETQRQALMALAANLPIDPDKPIEIVAREEVKRRKLSQNALMWVGPLADIAAQAYVEGRSFSAEAWHHHFKIAFLPEEFDPELCKDGYQKWDYSPFDGRILIGSTTQLTVKGMAEHLMQIEAYGANLGVEFHRNPNEQALA